MTIRERVNAVIANWCGQADSSQDQNLQQLWISTRNNPQHPHDGMPFQKDGVDSLIGLLTDEFKSGGVAARKIDFVEDDFEPTGSIKTIDDLVSNVVFCPDLT